MPSVALAVYMLALVVWVGSVAFFSLVVLPALFSHLEVSEAGEIAALVFPHYYRLGCVLGVALVAATAYLCRGGARAWKAAFAVAIVMLAAQAYATFVVHPEVAALRGRVEAAERFSVLHHRSVRLNSVVLLGGLALILGSGGLLERR